jgi:hypothetical protein
MSYLLEHMFWDQGYAMMEWPKIIVRAGATGNEPRFGSSVAMPVEVTQELMTAATLKRKIGLHQESLLDHLYIPILVDLHSWCSFSFPLIWSTR